MSETLPPPIYSQQDPENGLYAETSSGISTDPQILIMPTVDAVNFQKGYLGAEGERAAIEGELQVKGVDLTRWNRITISLRTFETAYQKEIELSFSEIELYSRNNSHAAFPSSFLFAIPLMPDTPQSMQTLHSSVSHTLTATLHPSESSSLPLCKSLKVHTRRYTSHTTSLPASPETRTLENPTYVEVQVPRTTFTTEEDIPVYVVIPPPKRQLVVDQGLRLRNVQTELVRVITVKRTDDELEEEAYNPEEAVNPSTETEERPSTTQGVHSESSSSKEALQPVSATYKVIIARSGASCRFHSSRPIQLRFVLHQPVQSGSPSGSQVDLTSMDYSSSDSDADSAMITQTTLLHSVSFHLDVHISFVDTSNRTERIYTSTVPITILPPPAPLPEISHAIDEAYSKKHDRPPTHTVRHEDSDAAVPHYSEGEAGPSMLSSGAPPPFEERDAAPPPFFISGSEPSSSQLPTFLESEHEVILPDANTIVASESFHHTSPIVGEGSLFGFPASQQFDGHSEDLQRSSTPPPTLEMASRDTDLTPLTDIEPRDAMDALGIVLEQREESVRVDEYLPPPPPAMDDPSDPPPSIDSEFRSPEAVMQPSGSPRSSSPLHNSYHPSEPTSLHTSPLLQPQETAPSHGHAPPPYLTPEVHRDREHVSKPPPYVD